MATATLDRSQAVYPILTKRADLAFKASLRAQDTLKTVEAETERVRNLASAEPDDVGGEAAQADMLGVAKRATESLTKSDAKLAFLLKAADENATIAADVILADRFRNLDNEFQRGHITRKEWKIRRKGLVIARKAEISKANA